MVVFNSAYHIIIPGPTNTVPSYIGFFVVSYICGYQVDKETRRHEAIFEMTINETRVSLPIHVNK